MCKNDITIQRAIRGKDRRIALFYLPKQLKRVTKEIELAEWLGLNSFRLHIPPRIIWEQQHDGCIKR